MKNNNIKLVEEIIKRRRYHQEDIFILMLRQILRGVKEKDIVTEDDKRIIGEAKALISDYYEDDNAILPQGFEWCRKAKYSVQIECGCYKIDENHPLIEGFEAKEFDGVMYAVKSGVNTLEKNSWTTNPNRPYIITGTVGERWPVKPSNLTAYEVNEEDIRITPITISTKDPSDQEFLVAVHIPLEKQIKVVTKWAFKDDGTLDESQVLTTNLEDSAVSHDNGDYIVAKHIDGEPEYMELPEEIRNTKEMATKYSPRVINGSVMATTYAHALTKKDIKNRKMLKL